MSTTIIPSPDTDARRETVRPAIFQLPGNFLIAPIDAQLTERVIWRIETVPADVFAIWRDLVVADAKITDQAHLAKIKACLGTTAAGRRDMISALASALRVQGKTLPLYDSPEEAAMAMRAKPAQNEVHNG